MTGIVAIIVKIMPDSPDADLAHIVREAEKKLVHLGAKIVSFEEKPIAFGLRALFFKFAWPEEKDSSVYEDALAEIAGVGSVNTDDYRRAFG
mgnify:CR=1 FL=1